MKNNIVSLIGSVIEVTNEVVTKGGAIRNDVLIETTDTLSSGKTFVQRHKVGLFGRQSVEARELNKGMTVEVQASLSYFTPANSTSGFAFTNINLSDGSIKQLNDKGNHTKKMIAVNG